jgi:hypothetical protein
MKVLQFLPALCVNIVPMAAFAKMDCAPAPVIGTGLPIALTVGGALLAFTIWKRASVRR